MLFFACLGADLWLTPTFLGTVPAGLLSGSFTDQGAAPADQGRHFGCGGLFFGLGGSP